MSEPVPVPEPVPGPVPVLLADRASLAADPAALAALFASTPLREVRLTASSCDGADPLVAAVAAHAHAHGVTVVLATGDHTPPPPALVVEDLGVHTGDLLVNGLLWPSRPDPCGRRPDRLALPPDADADTVRRALDAWLALCRQHLDGAELKRALRLRVEREEPSPSLDVSVQDPNVQTRTGSLDSRLVDVFARHPVRLEGLRLAAGSLAAARDLAELALRVGLARAEDPAPRLEVGGARVRPEEVLADRPGLARREGDRARRVVFEALARMAPEGREAALPRAEAVLGDAARSWVVGYRRYNEQGVPRVAVVPTWQCELRCRYCTIVKQDGREMSEAALGGALDLLFSAPGRDLELHFFGGEPLLNWPIVQRALTEGRRRAEAEARRLRFIITTNGWSLTEARLDWLMGYDVAFQLSLDGDAATMNALRPARGRRGDSYAHSAAGRAAWFVERGLPHDVIAVVHPDDVGQMADNFRHIVDMGYRRVQLNYAIGAVWSEAAREMWAAGLFEVGRELEARWARGEDVVLVNLLETVKTYRANLHPTVDWDGAIYGGNGFLYLERQREGFRLGHVDDGAPYHRYVVDGLGEADFFANWTWKGSADNNRSVGAVLASFVRWMRGRHPERLPERAVALGATARARTGVGAA